MSEEMYVHTVHKWGLSGFNTIFSLFNSKPLQEGKLFDLKFGHKDVRVHGVR